MTALRDELIHLIQELDDENVLMLLQTARQLHGLPDDDLEKDPIIGMFSGAPDLSGRVKEILYEDIDPQSGWTQKKD